MHAAGSYLAARDPRVHTGLGGSTSAVVPVRWPGAGVDRWELAPGPGAHVLTQGTAPVRE